MDGGAVTAELMRSLAQDLNVRRTRAGAGYDLLDMYYQGVQPLRFLPPEVAEQVGGRLTSLSINWARIIVGSIEERLDVEGFRLGSSATAEPALWEMWQANNLDEWSQLGHVDALTHGRSFSLVWSDPEWPDQPRITVESATQMNVQYRPGSRKIDAAAKVFPSSGGDIPSGDFEGWLYLPDRAEQYRGTGRVGVSGATWTLVNTLPNPLGVVPVVPIVNRPRLTDLTGESELTDVLPIVDAVNKLATDMMVSSEYHAMPRRYATGMQIGANPAQRDRLEAEARKTWDEATKGKTWLGGPGVAFGQFSEASLENFISAIRLLVSQIAAIAGLPPHYLGINGDNPASADAIRSAESSLVKKALRKQRAFGGSWEQVMRIAVAVRDGVRFDDLDPAYALMETQWSDPTTPTPGAKADATLKLLQGEVIDRQQAREDMGYTPEQVRAMDARAADASASAATADVRARVALAQQLMAEQGLSQAAAYATVGLLQAANQISATGTQAAPAPNAPGA
jgi:hypothetical protein